MEKQFQAIFETVSEGIVVLNDRGLILMVNPSAVRMFGYPKEELEGQAIEILIPGRFRDAHVGQRNAYMHAPEMRPMGRGRDLFARHKNGQEFPVEISLNQLNVDSERHFLALVTDISERKAREEQLADYAKRLEWSNRELEDFASIASHDLQEPLRKIRAFSDRLTTKFEEELSEKGQDYLNRIQSAAERMQTLISDILSFSRVTSRAQPFVKVDLNTEIAQVISDLEIRVEETGATLETDPLPSILGDPSQIRQLFQNLLSNAMKFKKDDAPPLIRIYSPASEANLKGEKENVSIIHVKDNGIGFDPKYADRIFTIFQRLHGMDKFQGSGIGLSVCRKIAERHSGSIQAVGRPGEGALFIVKLPIFQESVSETP